MNDSETALLHAYRQNKLNEYAFLRKVQVEDLFLQVAVILEKRNLAEELRILHERYIHKLHVDYLSGNKVCKKDWYRWNMSHPSIRKIAETLVWQKAEKNGEFFMIIPEDKYEREEGNISYIYAVNENGEPVLLEDTCEICLAHPVFMSKDQVLGFNRIIRENGMEQCFHQLKYIREKLDLGDWELWNRRYYKMELPYERLQELTDMEFTLDGSKSERIRISYYGKVLMEAFPAGEADKMRLGYLLGSNYNMREINESVALLDDAFCYEMILGGRTGAGPYLERFDRSQIEALLEASIELNHKENVAVLLEYKAKMTEDIDDDLSLEW